MYKFKLAFRYLYRRKISYLALIAVALCVFSVVVVMTVMNGLVSNFKEKNHNYTGDCVVGTNSLVGFPYYEDFSKELLSTDFIKAVSPVIKSYCLISTEGSSRGTGLEMMGVDAAAFSRVTDFNRGLHYHKNDPSKAFKPADEPNLPGCIVGVDLWYQRDSRGKYDYDIQPPSAALSVTCFPLTAKGALAKAGTDLVNTKTFYLSDFSQTGLARVDGSTIYVPFDEAQTLCGMIEPIPRISALHIKFKPGTNIEEGSRKVGAMWSKYFQQQNGKPNAELLAQVNVNSWKEYRREVMAGMEKEQIMLIIMFGLVGLTTVFVVGVVFYMIVSHKTKDIGILKSIGASFGDVVGLFLGFAGIIGLIGSSIGILAGLVFLKNINNIEDWLYEKFGFQLWDRTIYAIGLIPHRPDYTILMIIGCCAILACLAGAILPSISAAKARPTDTLQVSQL